MTSSTRSDGPNTPAAHPVDPVAQPADPATHPVSYPPAAEFSAAAHTATVDLYAQAEADRLEFWAEQARRLEWATPFTEVLDETDAPFYRWFADGTLNVSVNCVDRHVAAGDGDRIAIHWVGEPGDTVDLTYSQLQTEVARAANGLTSLGLVAGDRVALYLPMIPEALIAMLACARLGLTHSVVFAGFSAAALRSRIDDAAAKAVITADGQYRRGAAAPLKDAVDAALSLSDSPQDTVEHVVVVDRCHLGPAMTAGRDVFWHDLLAEQPGTHTPEAFGAEHPLFLLYTSGTTGKPKGIVHSSGGYLTQASYTHHYIFDHRPGTDVFWCTADIGWVTGHTYVVYGPLSNGATIVVYEGTPDAPDPTAPDPAATVGHRHFDIVEKYGVTTYFAAPTLIRTFMKWGREIPDAHDLASLRILGSVGEPINPEAWRWYRDVIGSGTTPIVDTWWQTETGAAMISPLPGLTAAKPGSAMTPVPGITAAIVTDEGAPAGPDPDGDGTESGLLVITSPWPSMARGIWGDPDRFRETYWDRFASDGWYFAGDGARIDADDALWVLGRVDDVMNISGHRISTSEVESALVNHPAVAEAAVVGASDEQTGQAIVAYVILRAGADEGDRDKLKAQLKTQVAQDISPIAKPRTVHVVPELPKTRSGKIMRRLLRDLAEGREPGDTSTLVDPKVLAAIRSGS